ncbi:type A2 lantipeptide [Streptomyces sp. NPDC051310]|uniref:type A2 lantipeptide n=1 Tax=Streptomyces sp. NPDC051310 TaxID=3365649 RepID=UPI003793823F
MTPQIQTQEISDADLDAVSGGLHSAVASGVVGSATATLDSVAPVTGVATSAVGAAESFAGLNSSAVTGFVAGL